MDCGTLVEEELESLEEVDDDDATSVCGVVLLVDESDEEVPLVVDEFASALSVTSGALMLQDVLSASSILNIRVNAAHELDGVKVESDPLCASSEVISELGVKELEFDAAEKVSELEMDTEMLEDIVHLKLHQSHSGRFKP